MKYQEQVINDKTQKKNMLCLKNVKLVVKKE